MTQIDGSGLRSRPISNKSGAGVCPTMDTKRKSSFAGAADVVAHAKIAAQHIEELKVACANGDKSAARRSLRQAISELELARAMVRTGID
ncbi:hypothetical protein ACVW0V_001546 [Bradyrhizobium elkanii]